MPNELDDLFEIHLEMHFNELKTLLVTQLESSEINANLEGKDIPKKLSEVQKQLLNICRSFYKDTKESIINHMRPRIKATENASHQTLNFIERIATFHTELNELKNNIPQNNLDQFLGYAIASVYLGKAFSYKTMNDFFFPKLQKVIDEISKAISLKIKDSWASQTKETIEILNKIQNSDDSKTLIDSTNMSDEEMQKRYIEVFHLLKNKYSPEKHMDLIRFAQTMGYTMVDGGMCQGYNMRWIEATILKQQPKFLNRVYKIQALNCLLDACKTLEDKKEKLEELKKQPKWKAVLLDINAFYDSLYLYHRPENSSIFLEHVNQENIEDISKFAASDEIEHIGGIKPTQILRYDEFSADSILKTLRELEEKIKESHYQGPVCFLLPCSSKEELHAINVTYNPSDDSWQWMDVNLPIQKTEKLNHLKFDFRYGPSWEHRPYFDSYNRFCMYAILPKEHTTYLENALTAIKKFECANPKIYPSTLYDASSYGDLETVQAILAQERIDLNQAIINGQTPLLIAACKGRLKIINALLAHKKNNPNQAATNGITPLYSAAQRGHLEVVNALLAHNKINTNQAMLEGFTPLMCAIRKSHLDIVKALLSHQEIDPNQAEYHGMTPLSFAAIDAHLEIVNALLAHNKTNPNQAMTEGQSPLYSAADRGQLDVVNALLTHSKINPNQATTFGFTPLMIAAINGHLDIVNALLSHKEIDPNQAVTKGKTALYFAAYKGELEVVNALLSHKEIDPNQSTTDGLTPLVIAVRNNNIEIIEYLLKNEKLDISKPLIITQEALKKFLRNITVQDNSLIQRLDNHIKEYKLKFPGRTMIKITPQEVALIMGHTDIQKRLIQFSQLDQSTNEASITTAFGR